jgi:type II secretory pathway component PulK
MPLNINTASEQALAFLDEEIDDNVIRRIIEARDRQPFRKDSEVQKFFSDELGLKNLWTRVMGRYLVSVRSRVFVVRAIGYVGDDRAVQEAVIDRDPTTGKIRVLMRRWRSF